MAKVIGLFGVSGIGKSYMARAYQSYSTNVLNLTASSLLNETEGAVSGNLKPQNSSEVTSNQEKIIIALEQVCENKPNHKILFDGHLILDTDHGLKPIELDVYKQLRISAFIHLFESEMDALVDRRTKDPLRDRPIRTKNYLNEYQRQSLELCKNYAKSLGCPCKIVSAGKVHELNTTLDELFNSHT